jgi:VIT1/CCC1 family predicted Fe2+/Mn2+ transporter
MSTGPLANTLRAAVLGANDGLASNLSLVMGVSGAHLAPHAILVTGLSGLVAGACAMAMGEWLSISTSRESYETGVDVEARQPGDISEEEREQLANIYSARGFTTDDARVLAYRPATPGREDSGGYAWSAARSSFLLFAAGALFPVLPFFFASDKTAVLASILVSAAALFLIGAGATLFTGRSACFSGIRQLLVGLFAAGVTYTLGHFIGAALS